MLEPVDIDINMNQNVSEEAGKASVANDEMTKSVSAMQKEIERLNKVIEDMSTALTEQKKIVEASGGGLDSATKKIEEMEAALNKAKQELAVYQSTTEQMNKASKEGADVTDVLNEARKGLSDTESTLVDNAKELVDTQTEIDQKMEAGGKSAKTYSASNQILSAAIKEVCEGLGIENTTIKDSIGNVRVIQAVKDGWRQTAVLLNKELGLTDAQCRALMIGGVGLLIAGIAALVFIYKKWRDEQDKINRLQQEFRTFQAQATASIQEQLSKVQILEKVLKDSNNTYSQRNKALTELKSILPEYNALLSKEGVLIEDNTNALKKYVTQLKNTALAKGAMDKLVSAENAYTEALSKTDLNDRQKQILKLSAKEIQSNQYSDADREMWAWLNAYLSEYRDNIDLWTKEVEKYTKDGIDTIVYNTKEYWENEQKKAFQALGRLTPEDNKNRTPAWLAAQKNYDNATDKLKTWDIKGQHKADAKAETETQKKLKQQKTAADKLEKMSYDLQKKIDDARVKAIHEGAENERAAAKADWEQTKSELEKRYKEVAELEKATGKPATEQRTLLVALDVAAAKLYETELDRINTRSQKTINDIFSEVSARFANELEQNISEINSYYDSLIKEATKAGATIDEVNRLNAARNKDINRAGINDKLRQTDLDEALEMEKANYFASIGLTTIAEQTKYEITKKYLEKRIKLLRETGLEADKKEADILEARLKGLQSSPKSISGLVNSQLFKQINKGFEQTGLSAQDAENKTKALFAAIQKGGADASAVISEIKGLFGGISEDLDLALDSLGSIAEGFASGGIAGGVMATVSQGIKMFSRAAQVEKEHQKALKELALAKLEMQREYNRLLLEEQLLYKQGSNIFGTDKIRGAVAAIDVYREKLRELAAEIKGEKPKFSLTLSNINSGGWAKYQKQLKDYNEGIGALGSVQIVTGSRKSGWGFWKKRKDVYSNLLDTYDDVIDKEGKLNTARIQAILDTHKMSDENRKLLESLLALSKGAEEAEQQLRDYLSQTFGGLGDALADSIVTAFSQGTDAAQLFKSNVTGVLNDLSKQMVFTLYLKDTFDKLQKDIEQAYKDLADDKLTEQQLSEKITNIMGGFFGGLGGDIENANKFLEEFWRNAEANGFDRPQSDRQGATGAFVNASQDSINELSGGVYAVRQMLGDVRNYSREELLVQQAILTMFGALMERSEYWEYLEELPNVVKKLTDIEVYGLKMKV